MKCIWFLEWSEIYLLFTHLVPVDIWNTLLKIHSLFLKEDEVSLPTELLISICSSVLPPKVKGRGGDSPQRAHSFISLLWSSSSETQTKEQSLLYGLSVVFQNSLDLMPYLNDHAG